MKTKDISQVEFGSEFVLFKNGVVYVRKVLDVVPGDKISFTESGDSIEDVLKSISFFVPKNPYDHSIVKKISYERIEQNPFSGIPLKYLDDGKRDPILFYEPLYGEKVRVFRREAPVSSLPVVKEDNEVSSRTAYEGILLLAWTKPEYPEVVYSSDPSLAKTEKYTRAGGRAVRCVSILNEERGAVLDIEDVSEIELLEESRKRAYSSALKDEISRVYEKEHLLSDRECRFVIETNPDYEIVSKSNGERERKEVVQTEDIFSEFDQKPKIRLVASYCVGSSIWKSVYKLKIFTNAQGLDEEQTGVRIPERYKNWGLVFYPSNAEHWAMIDNCTDKNWKNSSITLSGDSPATFRTNLRQVVKRNRPFMKLDDTSGEITRVKRYDPKIADKKHTRDDLASVSSKKTSRVSNAKQGLTFGAVDSLDASAGQTDAYEEPVLSYSSESINNIQELEKEDKTHATISFSPPSKVDIPARSSASVYIRKMSNIACAIIYDYSSGARKHPYRTVLMLTGEDALFDGLSSISISSTGADRAYLGQSSIPYVFPHQEQKIAIGYERAISVEVGAQRFEYFVESIVFSGRYMPPYLVLNRTGKVSYTIDNNRAEEDHISVVRIETRPRFDKRQLLEEEIKKSAKNGTVLEIEEGSTERDQDRIYVLVEPVSQASFDVVTSLQINVECPFYRDSEEREKEYTVFWDTISASRKSKGGDDDYREFESFLSASDELAPYLDNVFRAASMWAAQNGKYSGDTDVDGLLRILSSCVDVVSEMKSTCFEILELRDKILSLSKIVSVESEKIHQYKASPVHKRADTTLPQLFREESEEPQNKQYVANGANRKEEHAILLDLLYSKKKEFRKMGKDLDTLFLSYPEAKLRFDISPESDRGGYISRLQ